MKFFLICFISLFLTSYCLSQEESKDQANPIIECKVNYIDKVNKSTRDDEDGIEIGKFIPQFGGEGTYTEKKFRLGKLKMFVFASVLYEDDLVVNDSLTDAMTMTLAIRGSSKSLPFIAGSSMQIKYQDDFGAANLDVVAKHGTKFLGFRFRCERKK